MCTSRKPSPVPTPSPKTGDTRADKGGGTSTYGVTGTESYQTKVKTGETRSGRDRFSTVERQRDVFGWTMDAAEAITQRPSPTITKAAVDAVAKKAAPSATPTIQKAAVAAAATSKRLAPEADKTKAPKGPTAIQKARVTAKAKADAIRKGKFEANVRNKGKFYGDWLEKQLTARGRKHKKGDIRQGRKAASKTRKLEKRGRASLRIKRATTGSLGGLSRKTGINI